MFLHTNKHCTIYFGDVSQSLSLEEIKKNKRTESLQNVADLVGVQQLIFLQQNHGVQGACIKKNDLKSQLFQHPGDFIITQKKDCGIGVMTADCLPIVMYDPVTHSAGVVHAGLKGSAAGIFQVAVGQMMQEFAIDPANLQIYCGPAAGSCCYQIQPDFINNFQQPFDIQAAFIQKDTNFYFDFAIFTAIIARNLGIKDKNIYTTYNVCTLCDTSLCSFRREKEKSRRQVTLISLH